MPYFNKGPIVLLFGGELYCHNQFCLLLGRFHTNKATIHSCRVVFVFVRADYVGGEPYHSSWAELWTVGAISSLGVHSKPQILLNYVTSHQY
jgi:hypothetical protein